MVTYYERTAKGNSKAASINSSQKNISSAKADCNSFIQPKLTVNQPNDAYEREADHIADQVMTMKSPFIQTKPFPVSSLQRKCAHCEEEEMSMQRKERNDKDAITDNDIDSYVGNLNSRGSYLPDEIRNFYEPRFGHDFSKVKIHTDTVAAKSAQSINALAYTSGNNIVFDESQYAPGTDSGQKLLAHELTHVVQQTGSTQSQPVISRKTREAKSFPEKDGSEVTVERFSQPGHCVLVPKTQTKTSGDITSKNAFVQFDFCRGGSGGRARAQLNYGDAIDKASKAAQDFFTSVGRGQALQQASKTLEQDINKIAPNAEVKLNFQSKDLRVNVGGTGEASRGGGVSGKGSVQVEADIGPVTIGVEGEISGGTQDKTEGQVKVVIKNADKGPAPADCHVCNCSEPKVDYFCAKKPPGGGDTPPEKGLQPVTIPLFFEYKKSEPRKGWEGDYHKLLLKATDLINQGYTIAKIEGNTSPEGPSLHEKGNDFEGNKELADKRAVQAWTDLQASMRSKMGLLRDPSLLKTALSSNPDVIGSGELLGTNEKGEVKNEDLYKHLKGKVAASEKEGKDIFTETHVLGEDLPEEVRKENKQAIVEFTSGKREDKKLTRKEQLESLYRTLRRALIFLIPPKKAFDPKIKPELTDKLYGVKIDCTEEHKKLLTDAIPVGIKLFEGECDEQGKETKRFPE